MEEQRDGGTFLSSAHLQSPKEMAGLGNHADVESQLSVVRRAPGARFPCSGFEMSPWAGQDESAVTAGLGPQVPNFYHEVKKVLLALAGQKLREHQLGPGMQILLLQPLPPGLLHPSVGGDSCPPSSWRKEICSSAAVVEKPFCPSLHCRGNSLVLLFPVLSSEPLKTSGKTPWSRLVMGICRRCIPRQMLCAGREGSCKHPPAPRVPGSACC